MGTFSGIPLQFFPEKGKRFSLQSGARVRMRCGLNRRLGKNMVCCMADHITEAINEPVRQKHLPILWFKVLLKIWLLVKRHKNPEEIFSW